MRPTIRDLAFVSHLYGLRQCQECHERIDRESLHVALKIGTEWDTARAKQYTDSMRIAARVGHDGWFHPMCFAKKAMAHAERGELIATYKEPVWDEFDTQLLTLCGRDAESIKIRFTRECHMLSGRMKVVKDTFLRVQARRKMEKRISNMSWKELKQAASERWLSPVGHKAVLIARLQDFSQQPTCLKVLQEDANRVVLGYVREFREQSKCEIPICLQNLILMHYPAFYL